MTALRLGQAVSAPLYPDDPAVPARRWGEVVAVWEDGVLIRSGTRQWVARRADVRAEE